jgi:hypothetical protein
MTAPDVVPGRGGEADDQPDGRPEEQAAYDRHQYREDEDPRPLITPAPTIYV